MTEAADAVKSLHTALIDSCNGYQEALEDAEGRGLTGLFRDMIELRMRHAGELAAELVSLGETPDTSGSFMSTVHRIVISIRSIVTGLGPSILPGLIDGEKRIVSSYDDAIAASQANSLLVQKLTQQRGEVVRKIGTMEQMSVKAA